MNRRSTPEGAEVKKENGKGRGESFMFLVSCLTFHVTDPFPFGTSPNIGEERGRELKVSSFMNLFCQQD